MIVKLPDRAYRLGETPSPIGQRVVSWPWGGTPNLEPWSEAQLHYPLGTIIQDIIDGHPVIAQIQTHDRYGAHPEWGIKLHKGTSVFVPVTVDESTGRTVAMRDPPDGWGVSPMAGWRHIDRHEERWGVNRGTLYNDRRTGEEMDHPREWMGHWREHVEKIPKLVVVGGATVLGALAGPVGAVVGLAAGLLVDSRVRGGPLLPHPREWWHAHGDTPDRPAPPVLNSTGRQPTQAEWDDFFKRHPMWKGKMRPGKPAPPKAGVRAAAPGAPAAAGSPDTFAQAANAIQSAGAAAQGVAGAVADVANVFSGDFGVGTVIPSAYPKRYIVLVKAPTPDGKASWAVLGPSEGRSAVDAASHALVRYLAPATTIIPILGTDMFQTDRGDTIRLELDS